jgi:RNA polymerase sigma-70 factor (ECF subfamily)
LEVCDTVKQTGAFAGEDDFALWVVRTQKPLIRFCRQMVGDWAEAEDMAQEAFLRAWEKRASLKEECTLLTWQMAIARRVCLDRLRSVRRVKLLPLNERDAAPPLELEAKADVRRALESLNADDRAILYLRVQQELPFEEAARILGVGAAACRKRFERAKKRFEAAYGNEY